MSQSRLGQSGQSGRRAGQRQPPAPGVQIDNDSLFLAAGKEIGW